MVACCITTREAPVNSSEAVPDQFVSIVFGVCQQELE